MRALILLLAAGLSLAGLEPVVSRDEPLGLSMGMSKEDLQKASGTALQPTARFPHRFQLRSVPKSPYDLDTVFVLVGPQSGLCQIEAVGPRLAPDEVESDFRSARQILGRIYGGKTSTIPKPSPVRPEELSAKWPMASKSIMGKAVKSVSLGVSPSGDGTYRLALQYSFANLEQCLLEIAKESGISQ